MTRLLTEYAGPVIAPALLKRLRLKRLADLERAPLLHTETRPGAWTDWAKRSGWECRTERGARFEHFYFMLEAATAGLGVAIGPWPLVEDDIKAGRLLAPFGFLPTGRSYIAARRQRRSAKAEQFCAWLAQEAQASQARPAPSRDSGASRTR